MTAEEVIVQAMQAGVLLYAEGDGLKYKARVSLPPALAEQLKTHRSEVLAVLGDDDGAEPPTKPTPTLSAAERTPTDTDKTDKTPDYSAYEQAVLESAGMTPMDMPLLDSVMAAFPDSEVLAVESDPPPQPPPANPRAEAAAIIKEARRHDAGEARDLRDAWEERMAVCTVSGGLSERAAQGVALSELRGEPTATPADPWSMSDTERQQWISTTAAGTAWHERRCEEIPV